MGELELRGGWIGLRREMKKKNAIVIRGRLFAGKGEPNKGRGPKSWGTVKLGKKPGP